MDGKTSGQKYKRFWGNTIDFDTVYLIVGYFIRKTILRVRIDEIFEAFGHYFLIWIFSAYWVDKAKNYTVDSR